MPSGDPNVGLRKIFALEQEGQAKILGTSIGKTVVHVWRRRVAASAETLDIPYRVAPDFRADRNDLRRCLGDKPVERDFGVRHRKIANTSAAHNGFVYRYRGQVCPFGLSEPRRK